MRSKPLVLGLSTLGVFLVQPLLTKEVTQAIYTLGIAAKSLILFLVPFVIFGMIFRSASSMAGNAAHLLSRLLLGVTASTFLSVFLGAGIGFTLYHMISPLSFPESCQELLPIINIPDIHFIKNEWAMISGLCVGILSGKHPSKKVVAFSLKINHLVSLSLKVISAAIPLFIAGFSVKISCEGTVGILAKKYSFVFSVILISIISCLFVAYLLLARLSLSKALGMIRNIAPAAFSGLSTMSSAASLPLLVKGVEHNTRNRDLAEFASPIAVNIHMVGECFADVILAYAVLKTYNVSPPSLGTFLAFSLFFFLARFSCAGIPGGGILIIVPLLKKYFCFTSEMTSLITTLYLFLDPFITSSNLLGDGALCQWMARASSPPSAVKRH